ncbi:glycerophosphodiester phosphodiesterase [Planococcus sp. X10-3]|uniref:glycerophosphodiester phosphodiesterase n=1 Tax=Planococcus sp. X10-3 TaxID=3061240 RepID=UPI003BB10613
MKKILFVLSVSLIFFSALFIIIFHNFNEEGPLNSSEMLIIAHRGASAKAPEHTLEAYQMAKDMGADYIEIDLQMTKDHVLVAMHDDSVDRTTDGSGKLTNMTVDEIKKMDAGSWFNKENPDKARDEFIGAQIPTLQEIFDEFGDSVNYYIETKQPNNSNEMEKKLLESLNQNGLLDKSLPKGKVIIQSFSEDSLKTIHELNSDIPLIQLIPDSDRKHNSPETFEQIAQYAAGIGFSPKGTNKEYITAAREAGLLVHLFNVDDPSEAEKLKSWGATGVFTNDIEAVTSQEE